MGMDFVALMKDTKPAKSALDLLEADSPAELQAVARLMRDQGFALNNDLRLSGLGV